MPGTRFKRQKMALKLFSFIAFSIVLIFLRFVEKSTKIYLITEIILHPPSPNKDPPSEISKALEE